MAPERGPGVVTGEGTRPRHVMRLFAALVLVAAIPLASPRATLMTMSSSQSLAPGDVYQFTTRVGPAQLNSCFGPASDTTWLMLELWDDARYDAYNQKAGEGSSLSHPYLRDGDTDTADPLLLWDVLGSGRQSEPISVGWTRTGLRVQPPGTLYDYDSFLTMEFYQNITVAVTRSDFAAGMTMNAAVWNNSSSFQRPLDFTIMLSCDTDVPCPTYLTKGVECSGQAGCACNRTPTRDVPAGACLYQPTQVNQSYVFGGRACEVMAYIVPINYLTSASLPSSVGLSASARVSPGDWAFFAATVPASASQNDASLVITMSREQSAGDPVLIVKREYDPGYWVGQPPLRPWGVPTIQDYYQGYGDEERFLNRSDQQWVTRGPLSLPGSGLTPGGRFFAAVFNTRANIVQDAIVTLAAQVNSAAGVGNCPFDCSGPSHALVCSPESGEDRCVCRGTWAGSLCDAPLQQLDFNQQMTGQLDAGSWAYFTITLGSDNASVWTNKGIEVKVRYSALGNSVPTNPVLIRMRQDKVPTLKDYDFNLSADLRLGELQTWVLDPTMLNQATYYIGFFNVDFNASLPSASLPVQISLEVGATAHTHGKERDPIVMVTGAAGLSLAVLIVFICAKAAWRWRQARMAQAAEMIFRQMARNPPPWVRTPQLRGVPDEIVSTFPTRPWRPRAHLASHGPVPSAPPAQQRGPLAGRVAPTPRNAPAPGVGAAKSEGSAARVGDVEMSMQSGTGRGDDVCAVCLGDYTEGEEVRTLPCMHEFHQKCIDEWMRQNNTCPICRRSLIPEGSGTDSSGTGGGDVAAVGEGEAGGQQGRDREQRAGPNGESASGMGRSAQVSPGGALGGSAMPERGAASEARGLVSARSQSERTAVTPPHAPGDEAFIL